MYGQTNVRLPNPEGATEYRQFQSFNELMIEDAVVQFNSAQGKGSCGGGVAAVNGGQLTLVNVEVLDNFATLFGGGVYIGPLGVGFDTQGSVAVTGNSVSLASGAQIAVLDAGNVTWAGLCVNMSRTLSEVLVQHSGYLDITESNFTCPAGALFHDNANGLYGERAVLTTQPGSYESIIVSAAEFGCVSCPPGSYVLEPGQSSGESLAVDNPMCQVCPYGGTCQDGIAITAVPGYWGAAVPAGTTSAGRPTSVVQFAVCPIDYCCSGGCTTVDECSLGRSGRLCGSCPSGYSEVLSSMECRRDDACDDGAWFWPVYTVWLLAEGALLLMISEVWCARRRRDPSNTVRLVSYFFQVCERARIRGAWTFSISMCLCVRLFFLQMLPSVPEAPSVSVTTPAWRNGLDVMQTVLRLQFPNAVVKRGVCAVVGMSTHFKLAFGYINPLLVAVAMVVCFLAGEWCTRRKGLLRLLLRCDRCVLGRNTVPLAFALPEASADSPSPRAFEAGEGKTVAPLADGHQPQAEAAGDSGAYTVSAEGLPPLHHHDVIAAHRKAASASESEPEHAGLLGSPGSWTVRSPHPLVTSDAAVTVATGQGGGLGLHAPPTASGSVTVAASMKPSAHRLHAEPQADPEPASVELNLNEEPAAEMFGPTRRIVPTPVVWRPRFLVSVSDEHGVAAGALDTDTVTVPVSGIDHDAGGGHVLEQRSDRRADAGVTETVLGQGAGHIHFRKRVHPGPLPIPAKGTTAAGTVKHPAPTAATGMEAVKKVQLPQSRVQAVQGAALAWLLFAFTPLLSTTLTFLTCVSVPGSPGLYVFKHAAQECTAEWVAPLLLAAAALVVFAVCLHRLARAAVRHRAAGVVTTTHQILCAPYHPAYFWWESVLVWQRLVMAGLDAGLVNFPVARLLTSAVLCVVCAVAHMSARPVVNAHTQRLQTCLQASLVVVVLTYLPQAQSLQQAVPSMVAHSSSAVLRSNQLTVALQLVFTYAVPLGGIILLAPVREWAASVKGMLFR